MISLIKFFVADPQQLNVATSEFSATITGMVCCHMCKQSKVPESIYRNHLHNIIVYAFFYRSQQIFPPPLKEKQR